MDTRTPSGLFPCAVIVDCEPIPFRPPKDNKKETVYAAPSLETSSSPHHHHHHHHHLTSSQVSQFLLARLYEITPGGSRWRHILILPLVTYLILYALFPQIPAADRYPVNVSALVQTETTLFGGYLPHEILNKHENPVFDVLSAIPYTLHIPLPIIFVLLALIWERRSILPFLHCLGIASLIGVIIQFVFPTAPPWYFEKYGEAPASYSTPGDPAGLARVDTLFDSDFYHNMFSKSTIVFGAFPSLHITWATLVCLFIISFEKCCSGCAEGRFFKPPWRCPKWIPVMYVLWLSFAVVYLEHHYVLDVLGGLSLAILTKYVVCGNLNMCGKKVDCFLHVHRRGCIIRRQSGPAFIPMQEYEHEDDHSDDGVVTCVGASEEGDAPPRVVVV